VHTDAFLENCRAGISRSISTLAKTSMKSLAAASVATIALATSASAQVDFTVLSIEVNQAVQYGTTPLTGGRSTMVRTQVDFTGTSAPIDGLLRIFDGGVETANSPVYSDNGPFTPPAAQDPSQLNKTLNFRFLPPTSNNVVITVELNPAGPNFTPESDTSNNIGSTPVLNFQDLKVPEMTYVNVDLDPTGGSAPNPAPTNLIEPGAGDNFIQGIFPGKDWFYHRSDFPTKLWTGSVTSTSGGSALVSSLAVDRQMMNPIPDFIYGWVPGGIPYNGLSTIGGPASMGNSQNFKNQRTFAHELGHNFGLSHNSTKINTFGIDVEGHLKISENLLPVKLTNLNDIMVAGLNTNQAWVAGNSYNVFFNHNTYNIVDADAATISDEPRFMVAGLWNKATGAIEVTDSVTFRGGELTVPVDEGTAQLVVTTYRGGKLSQVLPISARSSLDECDACADPATDGVGDRELVIPFMAVLPANVDGQPAIDRVLVTDPAKKQAIPHDARRSQWAPVVSFTSPIGDPVEDTVRIAWTASDADGDELTYYLRYIPDGEDRMVPLATPTKATEFIANLRQLPGYVDGKGYFEIMATDGLNTTRARSAPLYASADAVVGSNPWIEIITPDNSTRYKFGSTVLLHSSGWDLEDRQITGSSIQWSSNLDGPLGSGRLTSVNTLSPGVHTLTVTATDSDGMMTSDTSTVAITNRLLPDGVICHPDIGFGGPGTGTITACGGDLSTGTTWDFKISGLPAPTQAWVMGSATSSPTAAFGGLIVPNPLDIFVKVPINMSGEYEAMGLPGGGGPSTLFLQVFYLDGAQTMGAGLTNALQLDFLP